MERTQMLAFLLSQDRLIRLNLDMLEGLLREVKADIEEMNLLAEACLTPEELEVYKKTTLMAEGNFLVKVSEVLDHIYHMYEVFNFDVAFLFDLPEELCKEVERLNAVNSINTKLELLISILDEILLAERESEKLKAILTPFRVYREVLEQGIAFNRKLEEMNLQKTG